MNGIFVLSLTAISHFHLSTETGGIVISPRPSDLNAEIRQGPMRPFFGIKPTLMDVSVSVDNRIFGSVILQILNFYLLQ